MNDSYVILTLTHIYVYVIAMISRLSQCLSFRSLWQLCGRLSQPSCILAALQHNHTYLLNAGYAGCCQSDASTVMLIVHCDTLT